MARSIDEEKYLKKRAGWFYYYRRVPKPLRAFYPNEFIRVALNTKSAEVARTRRDELIEADDDYWSELKLSLQLEKLGERMDTRHAQSRYEIAKARALAAGFKFRSIDQLASSSEVEEIVRRVLAVDNSQTSDGRLNPVVVDAVLGGVSVPKISISEAMRVYKDEIMASSLRGKSPAQLKLWHQTKDRSLNYFIELMGDIAIDEIKRDDALAYFNWWNDQIAPLDPEQKPKSPKTANKHFGDMRDLYHRYYSHIGEEDRQNPFRNLSFKTKKTQRKKRLPFSDKWVRTRILKTGSMDGLTPEIFLATCIAIETGCRPGEVINLRPEDICLHTKIPHLKIAEREDRQQKTDVGSIREIPLMGVALEAAKRAPAGFPKYHDKINSFSAAVSAAYTRRELFETPDHVFYSYRHSFEDRMKEAGIDLELRMLILGHDNKRPEYGTGGSMEYRLKELQKITHPYPQNFFDEFDKAGGVSTSQLSVCRSRLLIPKTGH